jgi:prepilin-type N-terminal cleavage/methylation domain-containing protein
MISVRNGKRRRGSRGFTLVEFSVAVFIAGILLFAFNQVFEVAVILYQRVRTQELVAMQIDPIKAIFQTHVRACRFALYDNLTHAEGGTNAGLTAHSNSTVSGIALRCTRRDGAGVFIIYWDPVPGGGADPGVYLITGNRLGALSQNPASDFNNPIPLSNAVTYLELDTSKGFVDVTVRIPSPLAEHSTSTDTYIYNRSNNAASSGINEIPYNFSAESSL